MHLLPLLCLLASAVVVFSKDSNVVASNIKKIAQITEGRKKLASALLDPATASKTADEITKAIIEPFKLVCHTLHVEITEKQVKNFILASGKEAAGFMQLPASEMEKAMNKFPPQKACTVIGGMLKA